MKKEDAIEILESMAMAESTFSDEESKKSCEAIDIAIKALKREEAKCDVPLTLAQLRKMLESNRETIGCPIIVSENGILSHAVLDARVDDGICAVISASEHWLKEKDYGKTWIAYAYPPAHIDREAWEPCGELCRNNCMTCDHNADELFGDADYCKDCHRYSKWESSVHKYCECCGRPKTPEAWAELEKRLMG